MAYFGNSMFGHHMQYAGQYNPGFGSTGFGQNDHSSFANKKGHGGSFGTSNLDPNGMMHHAHTGYHHYGHTGILRQNSLLGEMTQSKSERAKGVKPWAFSSFSYPITQQDSNLSTLYEKPLEKSKPKHPMLMRQQSFSMADSLERKRAPSFSSDPGRMRSRTVSTSSMPEQRSIFMRSMSIADDLTEPVNMDIAGPFLRRQQSLDIEKARRKSLKKPLLGMNIPRFSKHRRSSKTKYPETSSLEVPRSRCNSVESSRSSTASFKLGEIAPENRGVSKSPSNDELAQEKLILSLMNPAVPNDNMLEHNVLPNDMNSQRNSMQSDVSPIESPIESPTMVSRRVYKLRSTEQDNVSIKSNNSGQNVPPSIRSYADSRSSKTFKPSTRGSALLTQEPVLATVSQKHTDQLERKPDLYTDPADSDTSDVYYDCVNQSQKHSPLQMRNENTPSTKSKNRLIKKPRNTCSSSTCTDGEDTTSTCDTPPRATFRDIQQKYHPEYPNTATETYSSGANDLMPSDIHENDTLGIRDRRFKPNYTKSWNSVKEKPSIIPLTNSNSFSGKQHVADENEHNIPNPELIVPVYAPVLKVEPDNNNTESGTAESSESGYATSHIPTSPKNYDHIKVSQFVNSLPIYLDMDEQRSESNHGNSVANGSDTENDIEEDHHVAYSLQDLDLTNINCHSGSDTDNESINTDASISNLEVMKILDSPSKVRERVTNRMKDKLNMKEQARLEDSKKQFNTQLRKGSNDSETELLKLMKQDTDNVKDDGSVKSDKEKYVEVNSVVVSQNSPHNDSSETRLLKEQGKVTATFASSVIDRISFRREYSSVYQSRSTNCVDGLLHFLNMLLFLSSAGVVGIGIWLQLKDFNINDITAILGNNLLQVIIYVAIAGAGVALLAAFCLCCGLKQEKSGLGFYAFVLVAVIIALATAAVLSTIFSDKLRGIEFKFNFKDRLMSKYGVTGEDSENKFFTDAWNNMQSVFECCGGEGNENDTESWALYRKSDWFLQHANKGMVFVPESCCKKNKNIAICQGGDHDLLGPPRYAPPRNKYYPDTNPNLNANGCYPSLYIYLTKLSTYIAIVCGSLALLYFLTVMLTWVFCFKKSNDYINDSFYNDYYDIEEHDDVLNNEDHRVPNKERNTNLTFEETTFINTPVAPPSKVSAPILYGNHKLREASNRSSSGDNAIDHMDHNDSSTENSEQSETDDDTVSSSSTPRDAAIERRNMWLASAAATGYLLSVAIEEEDSNFEDSDDDHRISANV